MLKKVGALEYVMTKHAIAILLLMAGALQAQSATATEDWQAQWVWLPGAVDEEMMLARGSAWGVRLGFRFSSKIG